MSERLRPLNSQERAKVLERLEEDRPFVDPRTGKLWGNLELEGRAPEVRRRLSPGRPRSLDGAQPFAFQVERAVVEAIDREAGEGQRSKFIREVLEAALATPPPVEERRGRPLECHPLLNPVVTIHMSMPADLVARLDDYRRSTGSVFKLSSIVRALISHAWQLGYGAPLVVKPASVDEERARQGEQHEEERRMLIEESNL